MGHLVLRSHSLCVGQVAVASETPQSMSGEGL